MINEVSTCVPVTRQKTLSHIFTICVWGFLEGDGIFRKLSILRIPIPFLTLLYKGIKNTVISNLFNRQYEHGDDDDV